MDITPAGVATGVVITVFLLFSYLLFAWINSLRTTEPIEAPKVAKADDPRWHVVVAQTYAQARDHMMTADQLRGIRRNHLILISTSDPAGLHHLRGIGKAIFHIQSGVDIPMPVADTIEMLRAHGDVKVTYWGGTPRLQVVVGKDFMSAAALATRKGLAENWMYVSWLDADALIPQRVDVRRGVDVHAVDGFVPDDVRLALAQLTDNTQYLGA